MALLTRLDTAIIGQEATIFLSKDNFVNGYYTIKYTFFGAEGIVMPSRYIGMNSVPESIKWTAPTSFYNEIPNNVNGKGTLTVYFSRDSSTLGTWNSQSTFLAKIPDNSSPVVSGSVKTTDALTKSLTGNTSTVIQNISTLELTSQASATPGATVVKHNYRYQGIDYPVPTNGVATIQAGSSGDITFKCRDSRWLWGFHDVSLGFVAYVTPTISLDSLEINTNGVATLRINGTWFNKTFGAVANTLTVSYRYKVVSSSSWSSWVDVAAADVIKSSDGTYNITTTQSGLNYTDSYAFQARVVDKIATKETKEYIGKSLPVFDWSADDFNFNVSVSVLSPANQNNPATKQYVDDELGKLQAAIIDKIYPVGSIYMSMNSTDPQTLFGGTWMQLEDRFLLGAGGTYNGGDTGGEESHTLTLQEMPSHNHAVYSPNAGADNHSAPGFYPDGTVDSTYYAEGSYTSTRGLSQAHNNMPPYLVVFMWKRTK